jgi:hypothetical protein
MNSVETLKMLTSTLGTWRRRREMSPKAKSAGKKVAATRKHRAAGRKAAATRKHRTAGKKAARVRKAPAKKAAATRARKKQAAAAPPAVTRTIGKAENREVPATTPAPGPQAEITGPTEPEQS